MGRDERRRLVGATAIAVAAVAAGLLPSAAPAGLSGVLTLYEKGPIAIPNGSGAARMTIPMQDLDDVTGVTVGLRVRHERTQQLELSFKGPDGTRVELTQAGDTRGENLGTGRCGDEEPEAAAFTTFRDTSAEDIGGASAPYVGNYVPREPLSVFNGTVPDGSWKLIVRDTQGGADGKLMCALVRVPYNPN